jgi:hypothetical protein
MARTKTRLYVVPKNAMWTLQMPLLHHPIRPKSKHRLPSSKAWFYDNITKIN